MEGDVGADQRLDIRVDRFLHAGADFGLVPGADPVDIQRVDVFGRSGGKQPQQQKPK